MVISIPVLRAARNYAQKSRDRVAQVTQFSRTLRQLLARNAQGLPSSSQRPERCTAALLPLDPHEQGVVKDDQRRSASAVRWGLQPPERAQARARPRGRN